MADSNDVSNVLLAMVSQALYPNGTANPCAAGVPVLAYVGWPDAGTLDADMQGLNAGHPSSRVHVSIYPQPNSRRTTKYQNTYSNVLSSQPATITFSIVGNAITLGGTVATPQNVAVKVGGGSQAAYTYPVQPGDTLTSIATALAALIPGATSAGHVLTIPHAMTIQRATAGGTASLIAEIRRQARNWQVSVWAGSPSGREAVASLIDNMFAGVKFITLPDTFSGRLLYATENEIDERSPVQIYRRNLVYTVEYATTAIATSAQIVSAEMTASLGVTGIANPLETITVYQ